jgi:hypothetical protein
MAAIFIAPNLAPYVLGLGCTSAVSYFQATRPKSGGRLFATWLAILSLVGVIAVVLLELLVPAFLHAQTPHTQDLARIWMLTAFVSLYSRLTAGMLLGDHDFFFYYVLNLLQPVAVLAAYAALWDVGRLGLVEALAANSAASAAALAIGVSRVVRRHGLRRPDLNLGRQSAWYGLKAQGGEFSAVVNARLDALLIPAF